MGNVCCFECIYFIIDSSTGKMEHEKEFNYSGDNNNKEKRLISTKIAYNIDHFDIGKNVDYKLQVAPPIRIEKFIIYDDSNKMMNSI